ncbi:hypothetical protein BH23VER1_BH23VER1_30900 [soil metagenome]
MTRLTLTLFCLALGVMLTLGAGQQEVLRWPGYLLLAVAALPGAVVLLKSVPRRRFPLACLYSVCGFAGYVAGRALATPLETLAREDLHQVSACFAAYCLAGFILGRWKDRRVAVWVLVAIATAHSGLAAYQYFVDGLVHPLGLLGFFRNQTEGEGSGFFNGGNQLSGLLGLTAFLPLSLAIFAPANAFSRVVKFALGIVCLVGVAVSTSRGGLLATGAGGVALVVLTAVVLTRSRRVGLSKGRMAAGFGLVLVAAVGVGYGGWHVLRSEHGELAFEERDNSQTMRFTMWEMAVEQWAAAPVVGVGAHTYAVMARQMRPATISWVGNADFDPHLAHGDYFQLLAEYGTVGAVLLSVVYLLHLGSGFGFLLKSSRQRGGREHRQLGWEIGCTVGALAGFTAFAVHTIYDFNGHIAALAVAAACVLGFVARPSTDGVPEATRPKRKGRWLVMLPATLGLGAAAVGLLVAGIPAARSEYFRTLAGRAASDGEYLGAVGLYNRAAKISDANHLMFRGRGEAYLGLAMDEESDYLRRDWLVRAIESFHLAKLLHPYDIDNLVQLAETLSLAGGFESAEGVYQEAFAAGPTFRGVHIAYADHLLRAGDLAKAKEFYEKALKLNWWGEPAQDARKLILAIDAELAKSGEENGPAPAGSRPQ